MRDMQREPSITKYTWGLVEGSSNQMIGMHSSAYWPAVDDIPIVGHQQNLALYLFHDLHLFLQCVDCLIKRIHLSLAQLSIQKDGILKPRLQQQELCSITALPILVAR